MDEKQKRLSFEMRMRGGPCSASMIFGLVLVIAGTMMFVDNLAILPFRASRLIWPAILVGFGGMMGYRTRSLALRVWCGAAMAGGILLALREFDILRIRGSIFWPLTLIATGIVMLIYRMHWERFGQRFHIGASHEAAGSEHSLREFALFSQVNRRIVSQAFEGGEVTATFGGIELDCRHAEISNEARRAYLEANVLFGGVEIRIPEHWRVSVEGTAVFGQYEDKTIPPRPEPGLAAPVLVVRGGLAFGAVVLKN